MSKLNNDYYRSVENLISRILELRTIALVGLSKNSGKTSFLNFILSNIDVKNNFTAVMTTGRDGEQTDLVFNSEKPRVLLPSGIVFSTYISEANRQSPFIEIIKVTDFNTPLGKIIIAKTKSDIETQIIGPPNVYHQKMLIDFYKKIGINIILIDGSLNRKSIMLLEDCKGVIYLAGASYSSRSIDIINELEKEYHKSNLAVIGDPIKEEIAGLSEEFGVVLKSEGDFIYFDSIISSYKEVKESLNNTKIDYIHIRTSFTDKIFEDLIHILISKDIKIIFSNSFNIMLNKQNYFKFINELDVYTLKKVPILSLGVNSFSDKGDIIDCNELRDSIMNKFPNIPVIDIMSINQ